MFAQSHFLCLGRLSASMTTNRTLLSSTFRSRKEIAKLVEHRSIVDYQKRWLTNKRLNLGVGPVADPGFLVRGGHLPTVPSRWVRRCVGHVCKCNDMSHEQTDGDANPVDDFIALIRSMLTSMEDGETNESAYDTAWVALIKDVNGNDAPQFPSCLQWIADHQLEDGSWGCSSIFCVHDRILNTLACVVALKSWNVYPDELERGLSFIKENMYKLRDRNNENLLNCFEITFPALLDMARTLDIKVNEDSTLLQETYAERDLKLKKIPNELMHTVPTTLLFCLEGMTMIGVDWEKLLSLQFEDGSFFTSPSSTAYAYMQTKDENCLSYLQSTVQKFHGGVPLAYPVDIFERLWVVDRLQRLGISRHFQAEIKECLKYVYGYWTEKGLGPARNCRVEDIDDTCMGFRLLRLHGFPVSPNVFRHYEEGEGFRCYAGQSSKQGVTDTYNLFRASQLMFPGETILRKAKNFSFKFLKEKQASNQLQDRWLITKDLPGEVGYALDVPWYANLPLVETRFYIDQYGGDDDVWIAKTLYRMPRISNDKYLQLAILDFKQCQARLQLEWKNIQTWYANTNFGGFRISTEELLLAYFLAAASISEPERRHEQVAWAKTAVLMKIIASYFSNETTCVIDRINFINKLINSDDSTTMSNWEPNTTTSDVLVDTLLKTVNQLSVVDGGRDIHQQLHRAWEKWIRILHEEGNGHLGEAELLVRTICLCSASRSNSNIPFSLHDQHLLQVTNDVCNKLYHFQSQKKSEEHDVDISYKNSNDETVMTDPEIENGMQELVQLVHQNSPDNEVEAYLKQTCLTIAKTFYYTAYCDSDTINSHITKVFFERLGK